MLARDSQRWAFAGARQSVINRIANRSEGAIGWSLVECRRPNGRPTGQINLNAKPEPRTQYDICGHARDSGKLPPKYRNHIILSVTLLDRRAVEGMTAKQVADYATMQHFY